MRTLTVGIDQANGHLGELVDRVSRGERIGLTRGGEVLAYLSPARIANVTSARQLMEELLTSKRGCISGGVEAIISMKEEGRR